MIEMNTETLKALLMIALFALLETAMGFQNIRKIGRALHRAFARVWHTMASPRHAVQLMPIRRKPRHD